MTCESPKCRPVIIMPIGRESAMPQGTLIERLRAGGAGLGGVLTKTGLGTIMDEGKETLEIDGERVYDAALPASGLAHDGPSSVYERFAVPAGAHVIRVRLRDTAREHGFDYERTADVRLAPRQSFVIDFRAELGGFPFL